MDKPEEITHVDVPEERIAPEAGAEETGDTVSLADLAGAMTPDEIQMAKDQGLVPKDEAAEKKAKEESDRIAAETAANGGERGTKKAPEEKTVDDRFRILSEGKSPETIMAELADKGALSPEQEKVLLASLTKNGQSMYWAQKKERKARQKTEADSIARDTAKQKEIDDLKAQLAAANARRSEPKTDENGDPIIETDEERTAREALEAANANQDPRKKPLTLEDLDRIEKEKADLAAEEAGKRTARATEIKEALNFQQTDAKTRYADFDAALEKATDILRAADSGTLETLYPDPRARARVFQKCKDVFMAFATADKFEDGDFNAADMAYELGKEHPKFGEKPSKDASKTGETGADGNPETARRVISNANRRGSSAILNGGGSRRVSLEDLTPEQGRRIPTQKWNKLPQATRDKLLGKV